MEVGVGAAALCAVSAKDARVFESEQRAVAVPTEVEFKTDLERKSGTLSGGPERTRQPEH